MGKISVRQLVSPSEFEACLGLTWALTDSGARRRIASLEFQAEALQFHRILVATRLFPRDGYVTLNRQVLQGAVFAHAARRGGTMGNPERT